MVKKSPPIGEEKKAKFHPYMRWLIFLIISIGLFFWKSFPLFMQWEKERALLKEYEVEIPNLEKDLDIKKKELVEIENNFKSIASPFLIKENQMYPEKIDIKNVSKILELYSLQMSLVENTPFEILKITFGASAPLDEKNYSKMGVNINFTANEKMLKEFVLFLQTGEFSKKFEAAKTTGQLDQRAYRFLKENILPISQINSIKTNEGSADGMEGQISVNMQFYLFSQK